MLMRMQDWLALVAVHSDSWLIAVSFYYGAKLDPEGRWGAKLTVRHSVLYPGKHSTFHCQPLPRSTDVSRGRGCRRRMQLFRSINQHPTLYEVVTGKHRAPAAQPASRRKRVELVRTQAKPEPAELTLLHVDVCACDAVRVQPGSFKLPGRLAARMLDAQEPSMGAAQAAEAPLPTGRLLTYNDIQPQLKGRQAEVRHSWGGAGPTCIPGLKPELTCSLPGREVLLQLEVLYLIYVTLQAQFFCKL